MENIDLWPLYMHKSRSDRYSHKFAIILSYSDKRQMVGLNSLRQVNNVCPGMK
jgi:hypothetical protein